MQVRLFHSECTLYPYGGYSITKDINLSHWGNELCQCLLYGHVVISMLDILSTGLYTEVNFGYSFNRIASTDLIV